ncbi:MAG: Ppx/GppA family phosphatase [Pseudomonadota bacterium]
MEYPSCAVKLTIDRTAQAGHGRAATHRKRALDGTSEHSAEDWGPFGRPIFEDPSARALSRVGVVDVGSNSVRLVVFDGAARSPAFFYNEKIMAGLGEGLSENGLLSKSGKSRALAALKRFKLVADGMGISELTAVATAAMREARDGPDFRAQIEAETGIKLYVIDGEEEARLSAQGVLLGWPGARGLVCDIGGSSMELAVLEDGRVGRRLTSQLGPFRLKTIKGGKRALRKHINTLVSDLRDAMGVKDERLYLVGGSWRAIARIDMERRGYPLAVLHEYRMSRKSLLSTIDYIASQDPEVIRARCGLGQARMALVPIAAEVLRSIVSTFRPSDIAVSSYGIREGMLYEQMPQKIRDRDPLIEACRFAEAKDARMPGFGRQLYKFIRPLFRSASEARTRIIHAACLLSDVSWRAHPDYRHEVCFDYATRANLAGLTHQERVFLGVALLHRYKNSRAGSRFEPVFGLLSEDVLLEAEIVGKALRFGSMLSVQSPELMGQLRWYPRKRILEMRLAEGTEDLFGEVTEARFRSLAVALGADTRVITP